MTRVANFAALNLSLSQILGTQGRIFDAQVQMTTGKKSLRYSGVANQSNQLLNMRNSHVQTSQYMENNALADRRMQSMETNVATIQDIASRFRTELVNALNIENAADLALNQDAQYMLEEIAGLLNVKQDGRFLFAGSMTGTQPIDINDVTFLPPPGVYPTAADTNYYQGDATKLKTRVGEAQLVTYGVTGDEAGFEEIIRALRLAQTATTSPGPDTARLEESLRVVMLALDDLSTIRSNIGIARNTVEETNQVHTEFLLYAEQSISDIENVDIAETLTRLSSDQFTLEASYVTISRVQELNLARFLS